MSLNMLLPILGGLGMFLYGMKLMSESIQEAAGDQLKRLLAQMTRNRLTGVLSGVAITCMVQSSSITTVMVVGFVNAGLLKLFQAITVIMGANIGTTLTAWLVSLLGFKVKITSFALPCISLGVLFVFLSKKKLKFYGLVLVGFGFLFLGLDFMKSAIPSATKNPEAFTFLKDYVGSGFPTVLSFLVIGVLMTILLQSSSATTTITIALTFSGLISLEAALGMILGENIGTTITANIAALAGDINSKRAALAHTFFNLVGVTWVFLLFDPMVKLVAFIVQTDPLQDQESTRFHISVFHSTFNILNTILMIGFAHHIEKLVILVSNWFPRKKSTKAFKEAQLLNVTGSSVGAKLELAQIEGFNRFFLRKTLKNFVDIHKLVLKRYSDKTINSIFKVERELNRYCHKMLGSIHEIQYEGVMGKTAEQIIATRDIVKKAEEIGDCLASIARRLRLANKNKVRLGKDEKSLLEEQIFIVKDQLKILRKNFKVEAEKRNKNMGKDLSAKVQKKLHTLETKIHQKKIDRSSQFLSLMLAVNLSRDLDTMSKCLEKVILLHVSV